jgi:hypothetical protein
MCRAVLEENPTYGLLRHLQHQKRTQAGWEGGRVTSEAPAATAARGLGVAGAAQVHQQPFAGPLMSPPAQGVRRWPADVAPAIPQPHVSLVEATAAPPPAGQKAVAQFLLDCGTATRKHRRSKPKK